MSNDESHYVTTFSNMGYSGYVPHTAWSCSRCLLIGPKYISATNMGEHGTDTFETRSSCTFSNIVLPQSGICDGCNNGSDSLVVCKECRCALCVRPPGDVVGCIELRAVPEDQFICPPCSRKQQHAITVRVNMFFRGKLCIHSPFYQYITHGESMGHYVNCKRTHPLLWVHLQHPDTRPSSRMATFHMKFLTQISTAFSIQRHNVCASSSTLVINVN